MSEDQPRNRFLLPIAVFTGIMAIGLWFTGLSQTNRLSESRLERQQLLAEIRSELERHLALTLTATEILAHEIVQAQGRIRNFNDVAQSILDQIGGISNLQLAPGGIVRRIHPLAGNVEALGHDILGDRHRNAEALASVESGQLALAGPIRLVQGGVAVIARKPVYLWAEETNTTRTVSDDERPPFWGFVTALIMLEELLDSPTLASLADRGYSHQFSRIDSGKNTQVKFAETGALNEAWSDQIDIWIPHGKWTLSIGTNKAVGTSPAAIELAMTLLLSCLLAAITWRSKQRGIQAISAD